MLHVMMACMNIQGIAMSTKGVSLHFGGYLKSRIRAYRIQLLVSLLGEWKATWLNNKDSRKALGFEGTFNAFWTSINKVSLLLAPLSRYRTSKSSYIKTVIESTPLLSLFCEDRISQFDGTFRLPF